MDYELTAQQWRRIEGFLPGKASDRGVTAKDTLVRTAARFRLAQAATCGRIRSNVPEGLHRFGSNDHALKSRA